MALLARRSDERPEVAQLYSFGLQQTKLIVGLGNPGDDYMHNRHNLGFMALDDFAARSGFDSWTNKKDLQAHVAIGDIGGCRIILVKPQTFMNNSGQAVRAAIDFYKLSLADTIVVYDEVDLDYGKIQVKQGGGAAGHNGLKSVLQHVDDQFTRIRVGVGPKDPAQMDLADFVLQDFSSDQQEQLPTILAESSSILGEATASQLAAQTRSAL